MFIIAGVSPEMCLSFCHQNLTFMTLSEAILFQKTLDLSKSDNALPGSSKPPKLPSPRYMSANPYRKELDPPKPPDIGARGLSQ
jgi:hypothetical protein